MYLYNNGCSLSSNCILCILLYVGFCFKRKSLFLSLILHSVLVMSPAQPSNKMAATSGHDMKSLEARLPPGFQPILLQLSIQILRNRPLNIYQFCANYFDSELDRRTLQQLTIENYLGEYGWNYMYTVLKLLHHAHRSSSLVCYSVTYLEYKSVCRVVYAIPMSHISDIREFAMAFFIIDRELYIKIYA